MKTAFNIGLSIVYSALAAAFGACATTEVSHSVTGESERVQSKGGSMARFAIVDDYLYTLDNATLMQYVIGSGGFAATGRESTLPQYTNGETLMAQDSLLYVGSSGGMHIFDKTLRYVGGVEHFYACDPVAALDTLAFVTLNGEGSCRWGGGQSALQIYNVSNPRNPALVKEYRHNIDAPLGLGIVDSVLFVCDGGVKVFDARNPTERLPLLSHVTKDESGNNVDGYDIILLDDGSTAIVVGNAGLFQYRYSLVPAAYEDLLEVKMSLLSSILPTKERR